MTEPASIPRQARKPARPAAPSDFRRRLGHYLTGVAIGCVLAGLLLAARMRMAARPSAESGDASSAETIPAPSPQAGTGAGRR